MALEEIDTVFGKEAAGHLSNYNMTSLDDENLGKKCAVAEAEAK